MFSRVDYCLHCEAVTENILTMESHFMVVKCIVCNDIKGKKILEGSVEEFFNGG